MCNNDSCKKTSGLLCKAPQATGDRVGLKPWRTHHATYSSTLLRPRGAQVGLQGGLKRFVGRSFQLLYGVVWVHTVCVGFGSSG